MFCVLVALGHGYLFLCFFGQGFLLCACFRFGRFHLTRTIGRQRERRGQEGTEEEEEEEESRCASSGSRRCNNSAAGRDGAHGTLLDVLLVRDTFASLEC